MLYDKRWDEQLVTVRVAPWRAMLLDAADYIEKHGWTTGQLRRADGSVCALGAIRAVARRKAYRGTSIQEQAVGEMNLYLGCPSIGLWNDMAPGEDEVCDGLRRCATRCSR